MILESFFAVLLGVESTVTVILPNTEIDTDKRSQFWPKFQHFVQLNRNFCILASKTSKMADVAEIPKPIHYSVDRQVLLLRIKGGTFIDLGAELNEWMRGLVCSAPESGIHTTANEG